ncbi:hypothetical protein M0811_04655 [Anaeramoeba ignava]|uniref:Uncharacterized protein n=1 Tax=Anaeramoeba ignava TaxID=1746090 RepID=A0A9Q0LTW0_ANAIG|nr:hypothetical protein M0811_04655 [Anaeramoeba ignava]
MEISRKIKQDPHLKELMRKISQETPRLGRKNFIKIQSSNSLLRVFSKDPNRLIWKAELLRRKMFILPFHLLGYHDLCDDVCSINEPNRKRDPISREEFKALFFWLQKNITHIWAEKAKNERRIEYIF